MSIEKMLRKKCKDPLGKKILFALLEHEYLSTREFQELLNVSNWGNLNYVLGKLEGLVHFDLEQGKYCLTEEGRLVSEALLLNEKFDALV